MTRPALPLPAHAVGRSVRGAAAVAAVAAAVAMTVAAVAVIFTGALAPVQAAPSHEGGQGLFDVRSAFLPPVGSWSAAVSGTLYRIEARRDPEGSGNRDAVAGGIHLSYGARDWLELFGRFDAAYLTNDVTSFTSPRDGTAGAKLELPVHTRWLHAAVEGQVSLPWGKRPRGFSSGSVDPSGRLLLTVPLPDSNPFSSVWLHFNVGYRARGDARGSGYEGKPLYYLEPNYPAGDGDQVELRAAVHFQDRRVELFGEFLLDAMRDEAIAWGEGPLFFTPGFRVMLSERWSLLGASKIALAADDESTTDFRPPDEFFPDWQIGFALAWSSAGTRTDGDGDGVPDYKDRCPHEAEDRDGVQD
ncbi:MAG: hypothetical protein HKN12_07275, partial [Gemmatimonadetes bacterium]|nr:hypothetical protein [Gemmatimonadota bacterium]